MDWVETAITEADAKGTEWAQERCTFLCRNPIGRLNWDEHVYSDVVLTACQNAMADMPAEAMALLRGLDRYDHEYLDWLAKMVRITPMADKQRRAMFYGAVKLADAFLWAEAPHDD